MNSSHDWKSVQMPPSVARRPRTAQGYPVPFVNYVNHNGEPDLRVLSQSAVRQCVEKRLCAICGERLGGVVVFVGGPYCFENHFFADPAMHEECARYAAAVCPFLACQNFHHSRCTVPRHADPGIVLIANPLAPGPGEKRPEKMMLYFTYGFKWELHRGGVRLIKAYSPAKVEWF